MRFDDPCVRNERSARKRAVRASVWGAAFLGLTVLWGCNPLPTSTAQSSGSSTDVLGTLSQDLLKGVGDAVANLATVVMLRLFA